MPSAYIATQGTVPDSISDFWRMVWEYNAPTIIMLTNLEERGRVKCHKYWPSKTDSYGDIRVTLQDEVVLTEYTVRTYSVIKVCWCEGTSVGCEGAGGGYWYGIYWYEGAGVRVIVRVWWCEGDCEGC